MLALATNKNSPSFLLKVARFVLDTYITLLSRLLVFVVVVVSSDAAYMGMPCKMLSMHWDTVRV